MLHTKISRALSFVPDICSPRFLYTSLLMISLPSSTQYTAQLLHTVPVMDNPKQMPTWQETAKQMQDYRDASLAAIEPAIPEVPNELPLNVTGIPEQLLSAREIGITETPPEDLVAKMATGELTSTEVTSAFLRRAGLAQKLVRPMYPYRFEETGLQAQPRLEHPSEADSELIRRTA